MGISVFWRARKNHEKIAKKWPPVDFSRRATKGISLFPHKFATPFFQILGHFWPPASPICAIWCKTACWRCVKKITKINLNNAKIRFPAQRHDSFFSHFGSFFTPFFTDWCNFAQNRLLALCKKVAKKWLFSDFASSTMVIRVSPHTMVAPFLPIFRHFLSIASQNFAKRLEKRTKKSQNRALFGLPCVAPHGG